MKKQKKQNLLTAIIVILVIVLAMLVGSIVYEEMINMNKAQSQNTSAPTVENDVIEEDANKEEELPTENEEEFEEDKVTDENKVEEQEPTESTDKEQEYVGQEESNSQEETTENKDEKAIQLVKNEWGKDDTVTFSIEKKNGSKYRVAVRDDSTSVLAWYEVNTETWEVSEY